MVFVSRVMRPREVGVVAVAAAAVLTYVAILAWDLRDGPLLGRRWVADRHDVGGYFTRAQYVAQGSLPYRDVFSEYPTLATLSFGVPMVLVPAARSDRATYTFVWYVCMAACWLAMVATIARFRVDHGFSPWPALVLLAPSPLYFSFMRFDVLVALVACRSLVALDRGQALRAGAWLAAATHWKWYPAVWLPAYVAWALVGSRRTQAVRLVGAFTVVLLSIAGATIFACGWEAFLVPYRFHGTRGSQYVNPYWVLEQSGFPAGFPTMWQAMPVAFLALQASPVLLLTRWWPRSVGEVVQYVVVATWGFITFAKVDSPQWLLWYLPPALMMARARVTLIALTTLGVVNYAVFPAAYGWLETTSSGFIAVVLLKDLVLVGALVALWRERSGPDVTRPGPQPPLPPRARRAPLNAPSSGRGTAAAPAEG